MKTTTPTKPFSRTIHIAIGLIAIACVLTMFYMTANGSSGDILSSIILSGVSVSLFIASSPKF